MEVYLASASTKSVSVFESHVHVEEEQQQGGEGGWTYLWR